VLYGNISEPGNAGTSLWITNKKLVVNRIGIL
jgi:hypothetical protein